MHRRFTIPKTTAVTKLYSEWTPGQTTMSLEDASGFSTSGGFATLYIPFETIDIERRTTTFSYQARVVLISQVFVHSVMPIYHAEGIVGNW
jgi:hypothetical protein